jgi:predicted ATPase
MESLQIDNWAITKCFFVDGPGGTGKTFLINVCFFFNNK